MTGLLVHQRKPVNFDAIQNQNPNRQTAPLGTYGNRKRQTLDASPQVCLTLGHAEAYGRAAFRIQGPGRRGS